MINLGTVKSTKGFCLLQYESLLILLCRLNMRKVLSGVMMSRLNQRALLHYVSEFQFMFDSVTAQDETNVSTRKRPSKILSGAEREHQKNP